MSYTGSLAQSGSLSSLGINTGSVSTPAYTIVGEILNLTQSGKVNKTVSTTNLESLAEEFLAVLKSPGSFDFSMNRVPGDAGQAALTTSFNAKTRLLYVITLPKTPSQSVVGDTYGFQALVEEQDDISDLSPEKQIMAKVKLKVTGDITFTVGS
jgi:hypothetical protein